MVFNGAQIHLLVNHLPVIGFVISVLALATASLMNSIDVRRFVLGLTLITGLSSLPALWSGESAEEMIEHLPGVDEALIHEHEEAAELATLLAVITSAAAAGALILQVRNPNSLRKTLPGVFVLSLVALVAMGNTAHEGGKIQHPEIRSDQSSQSSLGKIYHSDDDD